MPTPTQPIVKRSKTINFQLRHKIELNQIKSLTFNSNIAPSISQKIIEAKHEIWYSDYLTAIATTA